MSTRPWTPDDLVDALSWFVPDDPGACIIYEEDGSIAALRDRQGGIYSPIDAYLSLSRPCPGELNGRRVLSSDGSSRAIGAISRTGCDAFRGRTGLSFAIAFRQRVASALNMQPIVSVALRGGTTVADSILTITRQDANAVNPRIYFRGLKTTLSDDAQALRYLTATNLSATDWGVLSCVLDHEAGTIRVRYGGATVTTTVPVGVMDGAGVVYPIFICGMRTDYVRSNLLEIGEFVLYDEALSDADMDRMEGYLAWSWGLQSSLSADHPYASAAPTVEIEEPTPTPVPPLPDASDPYASDVGNLLIQLGDDGEFTLARSVAHGGLALDPTLTTAVLVSLFSDAPIDALEAEQLGLDDQRGWWADSLDRSDGAWGSRLWALDRSAPTKEVARQAELRASEALQWLIADGVAASIECSAIWVRDTSGTRLQLTVRITSTSATAGRFGQTWEATYDLL